MDDRVSIPGKVRIFFISPIQNDCEAHPDIVQLVPAAISPGVKLPEREANLSS
jgi:hypothetical protein